MEIILGQGKVGIARLIARATNYPYTHCAIRYSAPNERWLVHSTVGGVQPEWWEKFRPRYTKTLRFRVKNLEGADEALDRVVDRIADYGYDYLSLVGFAVVIVLRRLGMDVKNPFGTEHSFMCTEVIVEWIDEMVRAYPDLAWPKFDSELTDPQEVVNFLRAHPSYFEEISDELAS